MTLSIIAIAPSLPAQATTLTDVLTPGTVVDARVLKLLDANLVRLAIASLTLDVATAIPLQLGQTLQLAVTQTAQGLSLAIVDASAKAGGPAAEFEVGPGVEQAPAPLRASSVATATNAPSPAQAQAVRAVVRDAAARQTGLAPLFANLDAAVAAATLPEQLQPAVAQLLSLRLRLDPDLTGRNIKSAFQASGLFREALPPSAPDLKAALIVLRQTLATFLTSPAAREETAQRPPLPTSDGDVAPSLFVGPPSALDEAALPRQAPIGRIAIPVGDLPGDDSIARATPAHASPLPAVLRAPASPDVVTLLRTVAQSPALAASDLPSETLLGLLQLASKAQPGHPAETDHAVTSIPPPPFRGALPSAQPIASPSLAPDSTPLATAERLLEDTDGAIARQTLLQVASLPDRADVGNARPDAVPPRWAFEIPFVTPQGTAVAQFEISKDGGSDGEVSAAARIWRARFSLDVEPAGPVHALISLNGETTSVRLWAERPATAAQLRSSAGQLGEAFGRARIVAGDIVIQQGAPTAATTAPAGHFLDRAT